MPDSIYEFNVSDDELFTAAMIVDSESLMAIYYRVSGGYTISVKLRREDRDDLDFIRQRFGGYWGEQIVDGHVIYWLNFQQGRAVAFLKAIYPYLEDRKESADIIFNLKESMRKNRKRRLSDEVMAYRSMLIESLRNCNDSLRREKP
jgi:hypothetical protein